MPVTPMKVWNARRDQLIVFIAVAIAEITRTAPARDLLASVGELDSGLSPARPRSQS